MPGNVTGPFMCGCTPPNYKYCPTCVFAEGKPLLGICMMYPGGMAMKLIRYMKADRVNGI